MCRHSNRPHAGRIVATTEKEKAQRAQREHSSPRPNRRIRSNIDWRRRGEYAPRSRAGRSSGRVAAWLPGTRSIRPVCSAASFRRRWAGSGGDFRPAEPGADGAHPSGVTPLVTNLAAIESALRAEQDPHHWIDRALHEAHPTIRDLQTKLGHSTLESDEAREAGRRSENWQARFDGSARCRAHGAVVKTGRLPAGAGLPWFRLWSPPNKVNAGHCSRARRSPGDTARPTAGINEQQAPVGHQGGKASPVVGGRRMTGAGGLAERFS